MPGAIQLQVEEEEQHQQHQHQQQQCQSSPPSLWIRTTTTTTRMILMMMRTSSSSSSNISPRIPLMTDREPPHNYTGDGVYLTFLWGKLAQLEAQNCSKHNHGPTRPPSSHNNLNTPSFRARRLCGWLRLAVAPTVSSFRRKRDPESSFLKSPLRKPTPPVPYTPPCIWVPKWSVLGCMGLHVSSFGPVLAVLTRNCVDLPRQIVK